MLKKSVGSLLAVGLLTAGIGSAASAAEVSQTQSVTPSWSKYFGIQSTTSHSSSGVNAGSANGAQVQAANTSGPATATQTGTTSVDLGDNSASGAVDQTATTSEPSQVIQASGSHSVANSVDVTLRNGKTIQHQTAHTTNVQFSSVVKLPSR